MHKQPSGGFIHLGYEKTGSMSTDLSLAIDDAFEDWNAVTSSTGVTFDRYGTDIDVHVGDTVTAYDDMCAGSLDSTGDITLSSDVDSDAQNPDLYAYVVDLIEHEIGHMLLLDDASYQASNTIMTNYDDNNYSNCAEALADAGYPSSGLGTAATGAAACIGTVPDGGDDEEVEVHDGGCEDWMADVEYGCTYDVDSEDYDCEVVSVTPYQDLGPCDF